MASILNQIIDQGATWEQNITLYEGDGVTLQNLTGYTIDAQVRKNYTSTSKIDISTVSATPATGVIVMSLTATQTAALKAGRYVYDLQITQTSSGTVKRAIEGVITVRPEVTR